MNRGASGSYSPLGHKESDTTEQLSLSSVVFSVKYYDLVGFPGSSEVKASVSNVGDPGLIPGSGRSPGEGNGNPLQYSCLENSMVRGAWWATVHGVTKGWTRLNDFHSLTQW